MDPVSALGLACNVLQLVELSIECASLCKEIYDDGSSDENNSIEKYTEQITAANKDLLASLGSSRTIARQSRIEQVAQEASATAGEIKIALNRLKLSKSQGIRRLGGAFKTTLRTLITSGTIKKLQKRLEVQDAALRSHILKDLYIKAGQSELIRKDEFRSLSQGQKDLLLKTLEGQRLLSTELIESVKSSESRIAARLSAQDVQLDQTSQKHDLQLKVLREDELNVCKRRLLKALSFPEINERRNMIEGRIDEFGDTYQWIFNTRPPNDSRSGSGHQNIEPFDSAIIDLDISDSDISNEEIKQNAPLPLPQTEFADWLESGTGLFWISGKPGSGKSTLMDYIYHRIQPEKPGSRLLNVWAESNPVVILTFWFFRPASTALLRTLQGFWRSLCFQMLDSDPNLVQTIRDDEDGKAPSALRSCLLPSGSNAESWTNNELRTWFWYLIEHSTMRHCLLIDGLDEVEDGRETLLSVLLSMSAESQKIKLCCASRLEDPFRKTLEQHKNLKLHDFNQQDIFSDCERRLAGTRAEVFVEQISHRAEGVFLWANLICHDLAKAADYGESQEDLHLRLKDSPDEMTELFKHMLMRQDKLYSKRPKPYLRLVDFASRTWLNATLLELLIATLSPARSPKWLEISGTFDAEFLSYLEEQLNGFGRRVESSCGGLVQCLPPSQKLRYYTPMRTNSILPRLDAAVETEVVLIHRSVHDFLREDEGAAAYYQKFQLSDDEVASMLMAGAASPVFFSSERLGLKFRPVSLSYAEHLSQDGWDAKAMDIMDALFGQLRFRSLATNLDDQILYPGLPAVSPDLSVYDNLAIGHSAMHALHTYLQSKISPATIARRKLLAAHALFTYLQSGSGWNRVLGEIVTTLSPYIDSLQKHKFLYHRKYSGAYGSLPITSTSSLVHYVVGLKFYNLFGLCSHVYDSDYLSLPVEFFDSFFDTELNRDFVELWSTGLEFGIAFPAPDNDCTFMREEFRNETVLVFHVRPRDILRSSVCSLKIVRWSPAGTERFFEVKEVVLQKFLEDGFNSHCNDPEKEFHAALADGLNRSRREMTDNEFHEIQAQSTGYLKVDDDGKVWIHNKSPLLVGPDQ